MAECHVVHLGRDSRIRAATVRIRRSPDESLVVDFLWRDQAVPVTEITLTAVQARALANELVNGPVETVDDVWDEVLRACRAAWPNAVVPYDQSPVELITRIINERDDAREDLRKAQIHHGFGVSRSWENIMPASNPGGGDVRSTAPKGGSIPPPSTDEPCKFDD